MSLWIPSIKRKKVPDTPYNIIAMLRCAPRLNRWQVFCFNYSHVLPVNHHYLQRIVRTTSPQSMNVGVWCKIYRQFFVTQLEAIHVWPWINTSALVKKGNGTQKKTKVSPWCTHCSYCRWPKGTSQAEATSNGKKNEPIALAIVVLPWSKGISQLVSQLVS